MTSKLRKSLLLATSALGLATAEPAFAQGGADANTGNNDIIVTARRTEERLQDVPISITVYNQEQISNRNITNSADLATYTPSLSVNSRYGPEKASFAIRGFVQDFGTEPSVGVYFADVIAARGASTTTGGNGVGVGSLFDLQNVQILKGPQGTLFGRNTTGGAVLLVPNKPTDRLEGYVEGSAGNYSMWRAQAVLNIPLADTFKVRLGVDHMKRDGYLHNHSPIGPKRMADTDYWSARLSILADLTPDLENYTIASYSNSDNHGTTFKVLGCLRPPAVPAGLQFLGQSFGCRQLDRQNARGDGWWDIENSEPNPRVHIKNWQVINTTTWRASDNLTIKNIASYAENYETTNLSLGGDYWTNTDGSFFRPVINIDSTPGYHYGAESTASEELQFQGHNGKLTWQAGGYYEQSDPIGYGSQSVPLLLNCTDLATLSCQQGFSLAVPLPGGGVFNVPISNLGRPFYKVWWRSKGLYAQGTYEITDKLNLTGGFRYTWDSHRHYQSSINIQYPATNTPVAFCSNTVRNPGPGGPGTTRFLTNANDFHQCDLTFSKKWKKPTWLIDLEFKPNSDIMLFAKWARGYRAGGVNTPFVFFETWDPEKVDTYELGAKTSFNTGGIRGYFNVTGFYNDFRNQQIQATLTAKVGAPSTGGTAIVNAGKSRLWGIEVEASATLFQGLKLDVDYAYLNTKLLALTGIPAPDNRVWKAGDSPWAVVVPTATVGGPLAFSPKNRVQATLTYTLPVDESIGTIAIGGTFVHTDSQNATSQTASPLFYKLPATNLLNLNVSWNNVAGQPIDASFFMTNVTKEKYWLAASGFWGSFGFDSAPVNEPRMWGFRLRYRFGD